MTTFDPDAYLAEKSAAQPPQQAAPQAQAFDPNAYLKDNPAPAPEPYTVWKGAILPISKNNLGQVSFDPFNAGLIGAAKEAFTLPGRVYKGETKVDVTDPNFMADALNFTGTFGMGINPMVRSGDRAIPGVKMAPKDPALAVTPSSKEMIASGKAGHEAYKQMPIPYDPAAFGALGTRMEDALVKEGLFREGNQKLYAAIDRLRQNSIPPNDPTARLTASPASVIAMRKNFANLFGDPTENQKGVGVAFGLLNDFIEKPPKEAVLAGTPPGLAAEGGRVYARGRADFSYGTRAKELEDIKRTADLRTASANSGANPDNQLRSRITTHLLNARRVKGYTPEDIAQLETIPLSTTTNNIKRAMGNAMGGGGGLGAVASSSAAGTLANYLGLPPGAATAIAAGTPAIGNWLKRSAGESTAEALDRFIDMQKRRSPLFQSMGRQDLVHDTVYGRDAIARALARMEAGGLEGVPVKPVLEYDPNRA